MNNLDQSHVAKWMDSLLADVISWYCYDFKTGLQGVPRENVVNVPQSRLWQWLTQFLAHMQKEAGKFFCEQTQLIV